MYLLPYLVEDNLETGIKELNLQFLDLNEQWLTTLKLLLIVATNFSDLAH